MSADRFWVETAGPYPIRDGNLITPLIDGEPAFRRICALIDAARASVWVTVTFMWPEFRMPDGRTALEVLDGAARRGVDVRVIFWRLGEETRHHRRNAFEGSEEHFEALRAQDIRVKIRWDRAAPGFCQHQKSWLIDAGEATEIAIVGGINLNPHSVASPGHAGEGQNHDVYVELRGPSVADVHHNFVQRWREASERDLPNGRWGAGSETDPAFPAEISSLCGSARAQIQRTIHPGRLEAYPFSLGERTILEQYCAAIAAAQDAIYLENQYIEVIEIVDALQRALDRGVAVVWLAPAVPDIAAGAYRPPERQDFFEARARLCQHPEFTLAGIAGLGADGARKPVYVHSKLMLIDDEWGTVGSANLHRYSLFGNAEMNVAFADPASVRALRTALFQEHLGEDTHDLGPRAALDMFQQVAQENRAKLDAGDPAWRGLAFSLDISSYGLRPRL